MVCGDWSHCSNCKKSQPRSCEQRLLQKNGKRTHDLIFTSTGPKMERKGKNTHQIGLVVQLSLTGKKQCGEATFYIYIWGCFCLFVCCFGVVVCFFFGGGGGEWFWSRMQRSFLYSVLSHHSAILALGLNSSTVKFTLITLTNFCTLPKKKKKCWPLKKEEKSMPKNCQSQFFLNKSHL